MNDFNIQITVDSVDNPMNIIEFEQDRSDSEAGTVFIRLTQNEKAISGTFDLETLRCLLNRL